MAANDVGAKLRAWRKSEGLTQREAAERAGISQSAWCEYESGKMSPRATAMQALILVTRGSKYALTLALFVEAQSARTKVA